MAENLRIDIRDKRLAGKRMEISARTAKAKERDRREASLRTLLDKGMVDVLERLRAGELHIALVHKAVQDGDFDALRPMADTPLTLEACLNRVIARDEASNAEGTVRGKKYLAAAMKKKFGADRPIPAITSEEIEAYLFEPKTTTGKVWTAGRQESARQLGLQAWDIAIATERDHAERLDTRPRITRNAWREVKISTIAKNAPIRPAFLQREEWLRIEVANDGFPELALMALGALAGLREGESTNLRLGRDIDLEDRVLHIQPRKGEFAWSPKGARRGRSVRDVPINDRLHGILVKHIELGYAGTNYLLRVARRDQPMSPTAAQDWTEKGFGRATRSR